jgi:hypothetical protein
MSPLGGKAEVLGRASIGRRADAAEPGYRGQAGSRRGSVDAPQHVELVGDDGRPAAVGDQLLVYCFKSLSRLADLNAACCPWAR